MCIICVKPQGVKFPEEKILRNMFDNNPHGAGFMYAKDGKVEIRKGFMTFKDFSHALNKARKEGIEDGTVVMHFRITTHGGTCPQNTHPFPLTDDIGELRSLATSCDIGVAHNGIIKISTRDKSVSDTQEFIASVLTPVCKADPRFYKSERIREGILECTDYSRMVFLNGAGEFQTVGFFENAYDCLFSNDSYMPFDYRWLGWLGADSDMPPVKGKRKRKSKKQRKQEALQQELDRKSVRLPWEQDATLMLRLIPLNNNEYLIGEEGVEYEAPYHAFDRSGRIYYVDRENNYAYETYDTVQNYVTWDKSRAEYFELR